MATLSLKISVVEKNVVKTMQFDPSTIIYDACKIIREKISEANLGNPKDYGLFLADEDPKKGVWLELGRNLEYYLLRNGDLLEYKKKTRTLRIRMLDGTVKTMMVDDSLPAGQLMVIICTRLGITNYEEYSLVKDMPEDENEKMGTLRKDKTLMRDQKKMEQLKRKLHTDDELNWIDQSKTLREQGVDENETLLLRRKFFYSDQNIDSRDPVQLNLLYVQSRDAIINGTHPVTLDEACQFAGIQCQIQFGDNIDAKHKAGFLDLKEFLPKDYVKVKGVEKRIFTEHKKYGEHLELDAKVKYTALARSLKTYGVTFFLVKEKMKGKNKLVPRLLGVTKDSVLRLDEKTKEILKVWPLTTVRRWAASPNSFTLDFGDYSDSYYSVQTTEGEQISQLIAGYIDIILKKKKAKDHFGIEGDEGSTLVEDEVSPAKATIMQHQTNKITHPNEGHIAIPAVMREVNGAVSYSTGSMDQAQYGSLKGQAHSAYVSPMHQQRKTAETFLISSRGQQEAQRENFSQPISSPRSPQKSSNMYYSFSERRNSPQQDKFGRIMYGSSSQPKVSDLMSKSQKALIGTIDSGRDTAKRVEIELQTKAQVPQIGSDPASKKWKEDTVDLNKQTIVSQLAAINSGTAQVITLTSGPPDEIDHTSVGAAIGTISSNLGEMSRGVTMLAALMEDPEDGERLLEAARRLCIAFSDLLRAAEPDTKVPRQELLSAASKIGEASKAMIQTIGEEDEYDKNFEDALLGLAKAVANATAALVLKAKNVASTCDDQGLQNKVISSATQCALATSQLVACAKVVSPTITSPACQEQLIEAAKEVAKAVEGVVGAAQSACKDEQLLREVGVAATQVTQALNDLLQHVKQGKEKAKVTPHDADVDTILTATDNLFKSMGDASEMVKQAKILAQTTSHLVSSIKGEAESLPDSDMQKRLLAAAKNLADATARLVEAAKGCASSPHDSEQQQVLRQAAEELRTATNAAAQNALKKKLVKKLENAAKQAAATATQTIAAAQAASPSNRNHASQQQLITHCKEVADTIPRLVQGVKASMSDPDSTIARMNLINSSNNMIMPCSKMITAARAAVPTVSDHSAAMQLNNSSKQMNAALTELRTAVSRAQEACGPHEIDNALDLVNYLDGELAEFKKAVDALDLLPLPGETLESSSLQLGATSKTVGSAMAQLLTSAAQGNESYTGFAARDTANALKALTGSVRGVAANSKDKEVQHRIIDSARDVVDKSGNLLLEAKKALQHPNNPENQQRLAQVAKAVSVALNNCVNCLPGQRDVDEAIKNISTSSQILTSGQFPRSSRPYGETQTSFNTAAVNLNVAAGELVASVRGTPQQLATSSFSYSKAFGVLLDEGLELAGQSSEPEFQSQMISNLRNVSMVSSKLLLTAKSTAADPNAPNAKNQLAAAARAVTESINQLINLCTSSAPGQKECDNALRNIQMMRNLLDNPNEPVNDMTYYECLDSVMEKSKNLGDGMTGIANYAKKSEVNPFGDSVRAVSDAVCGLIEAAAQAAYLIGISDPSSIAGRPGLVDQSQFARANQAIQQACQNLTNPSSTQQQILSAATVIAKHTSSLCNSCRLASAKTTNPVAKRHFVQSAKDVANATANLVKCIKTLDTEPTPQSQQLCAAATRPLIDAVDSLTMFASSPEFASFPAKISPQARVGQEPVTSAGKSIIDGSCCMITSAKSLILNPKDPPTWQSLASHSKSVSDSIKRLVSSIREKAPGQKECEEAIHRLNAGIKELDQASLAAISQSLQPRNDNNLQGFHEQLGNSTGAILDSIDGVRNTSKSGAERLGHEVSRMVSFFDPLIDSSIGTASKTMNSKRQMAILDQTKTLTESALQLIYTAKETGGNPKARHLHKDVDEAAEAMQEAVQDLMQTLEAAQTEAGVVTSMVDTITKAIVKMDESLPLSEDSFVDYQTRMVIAAKEINKTSQEMLNRSTINVNDLGPLAAYLSHSYAQLANDSRGAQAVTANSEVSSRIRTSVQDLGNACIELVKSAGALQTNPNDSYTQKDLAGNTRSVSEKVSFVLAVLQTGSRGTQACINAASTVSGIIGDLDTTIMFATAGTLHAENENETFSDHRENILKTAKALVEDTKTLVAGAASSQEQLAVAAQNAVHTITQLADVVKFGAASLGAGNPDAQVLLINAVKDVASALGDLIQATKNASGKNIHDPAMMYLKESAKVMVTNVTSLLKTVKTVEDEHARGTRALESTIEAIAQEVRAYDATDGPNKKATPEELIRSTKSVTIATAKAVAAGNSCKQEDAIVAANMGRKAICDVLVICKAASQSAEGKELRLRTVEVGRDCAINYRELLQLVHSILLKPSPEGKQGLIPASRKIANSVTEIVATAEAIKGNDWVDPEDPTVIAENELLGAAASIDAAAKKLAILKPRRSISKENDENLPFDEMILDAAKSITAATAALVRAASAAQRELVVEGKVGARPLYTSDDGQWSEGLISAAKMVAAATHSLCEAANSLVQGHATEEKLISSAKQVASSTAQLLVACKVKADPDSHSMLRLQSAGNAVKRATDNLVRAAQQAIDADDERNVVINRRFVGGIAQEIMAQEEILRKEKELEEARCRLIAIRKAKYGERSDDEYQGYGSSFSGYQSGYGSS